MWPYTSPAVIAGNLLHSQLWMSHPSAPHHPTGSINAQLCGQPIWVSTFFSGRVFSGRCRSNLIRDCGVFSTTGVAPTKKPGTRAHLCYVSQILDPNRRCCNRVFADSHAHGKTHGLPRRPYIKSIPRYGTPNLIFMLFPPSLWSEG